MDINYQDMMIGGGVFYGLLVSVTLLFSRKGNTLAKRLMATLVIIYCLCMANYLIFLTGSVYRLHYVAGNTFPLFFLIGPVLLLYTKSLNSHGFKFKRLHFLYFIPYIIWQCYFIPSYFYSHFEKLNFLKEFAYLELQSVSFWFALSNVITNLVFIALSIYEMNRFRKSVSDNYSNETGIRTRWTQQLLGAIGIVTVYNLITLLLNVLGFDLFQESEFIGTFIFLLLIVMIGIHTLNQPNIYVFEESGKVRMDSSRLKKMKTALENYMVESKAYLDADLRLNDLADSMNTSPHELSRIVNEGFNKNFFEFVNEYRIVHAKSLLLDNNEKNVKLFSIAVDSGFNTKGSFNRTFKRHVGVSPSLFRDKSWKNHLTSEKNSRLNL